MQDEWWQCFYNHWMLPHCIFHALECQSSAVLCGDMGKVGGSVASVRYSQGLLQRCSTRSKFLFTSEWCCLLFKVRKRQRRERVIDQRSLKKCLLQSTIKFRILLYRHKGYVSLHMYGSFPKALCQSFSLVFNSEPLPSSTAEQITSPLQAGGSSCSSSSPSLLSDQRQLGQGVVHPHMAQSPAHRVILHGKDTVRSYSLCSSLSAFRHLHGEETGIQIT